MTKTESSSLLGDEGAALFEKAPCRSNLMLRRGSNSLMGKDCRGNGCSIEAHDNGWQLSVFSRYNPGSCHYIVTGWIKAGALPLMVKDIRA